MRDEPKKKESPSRRRASSSSAPADDEDDDDLVSTKTPASSPFPYPDYDDDDEEEDDDDDANLLEILIETLTGTTFQVRVSPWETGAGLKGLLHRTQGIPLSQQHILLGQRELTDDAPLIDQGVQDGANLKLVLSMKGGPINTPRAYTQEDDLLREFEDYMNINRDELWEGAPGRPVTLLVLREGDAVNLYRVIENEDGTYSPLNETWGSNGSGSGKLDGSDKESVIEEEVRHKQRMLSLKEQMEKLKLAKNEKRRRKKAASKPASPSVKVSLSARARKSRHSLSQSQKHFKKVPLKEKFKTNEPRSAGILTDRSMKTPRPMSLVPSLVPPPKIPFNKGPSRPTTQETPYEMRRISISRGQKVLEEIPRTRPPKHVEFSRHPKLDSIPQQRGRFQLQPLTEDTNSPILEKKEEIEPVKSKPLQKKPLTDLTAVDNKDKQKKSIHETRHAWSGRKVPLPLYADASRYPQKKPKLRLYQSYNQTSLKLPKDLEERPKTSPEILERRPPSTEASSNMSDRMHLRGSDDKLKEIITILNTSRTNSRLSQRSILSPPHSIINQKSTSFTNQKSPSIINQKSPSIPKGFSYPKNPPLLHKRASISMSLASLRGTTPPSSPSSTVKLPLNMSDSRDQLDILRDFVKMQGVGQRPSSRRSTPETGKKIYRPGSGGQFKCSSTPRGFVTVTPKHKVKLRPRCQQCRKKIGVVTSYPCRCGHVFCAQHRYAETHECTFDYKSAGRKLIEIANPLVLPPKLPKI